VIIRISPRTCLLAVPIVLAVQAGLLLAMGRVPYCTCGYIKLWHGAVNSSENSQQILDWYSFTHVVHGFALYFFLWLVWRRGPVALRLVLAVMIEGGWEILENSPVIIERYRAATIALDYFGDSVINSLADTTMMIAGFTLAAWLPVWGTAALAFTLEVTLGYLIHDNLTLNILMLAYPLDTIKVWQAAAPLH
jgi:hypothetical protein